MSAQSTDPSAQPRLAFDDLMYVGGFRLPANTVNGDSFSFGGRQLTFNPVSNSLFVGSRVGRVAEVSIPSAVNTTNAAAMPYSTYLQPFSDPTEGHLSDIATDGVNLDGLLVYNNRLYGTASVFYDAMNAQRVSHYSRSLQLNEPSFSGWQSVWDPAKTGFVSGTMSVVPTEWRALLGGPAATGQCCIPIVSRTSWGPSAFAFNPEQLGPTPAPAAPLLYYTGDHATLGAWDAQNETYGSTTFMGGMAIIAGTRTALYLGRNGMGPNCYGNGTGDQTLVGTLAEDGAHYCYDPTSNDKGTHAYPYRYQIWAYDLNDFAAVKAGTKQPWDVVPYAVWPLELPTQEQTMRLGGVGYDPATQRLYVSQMYADQDGYAYRPVVHVLQINAAAGQDDTTGDGTSTTPDDGTSTTPPPADTTTPPSTTPPPIDTTTTSTVVTSIALAVNRNAPQAAGTAITFTASVVGGVVPHEYKWLINNGTDWQAVTSWSTLESFTWTPGSPNANYRVGVWARSSGNTRDEPEASLSTPFAIVEPPSQPVPSVTIATNKTAPQTLGTPITFTATAGGGSGPVQYKFLVYDGSPTWQHATGWTTSNTFTWTAPSARNDYAIRVWARANGATQDAPQAEAEVSFPISAPVPVLVNAVTLAADKAAPQTLGTSITLTAAASGGVAPVQYKFLLYDGSPTWQPLTGWISSNAVTWTPTAANAEYAIRVWARGGNSTTDAPEAEAQVQFPISAPAPVLVSSVALVTNKTAPQAAGTAITFTATGAGGVAPVQYKFLVYNGSPTWTFLTGWTTSNTFTWTPSSGNAEYRMRVWARSSNSTTDAPEAEAEIAFPITGEALIAIDTVTPPAPALPIAGVTLSTDKPSPQFAGTTIVATATVSGGSSTLQYRWLIHDGNSWNVVTGWTTSKTFTWTPTAANPGHFIGVWVKNAANTADAAEATMSLPFIVK